MYRSLNALWNFKRKLCGIHSDLQRDVAKQKTQSFTQLKCVALPTPASCRGWFKSAAVILLVDYITTSTYFARGVSAGYRTAAAGLWRASAVLIPRWPSWRTETLHVRGVNGGTFCCGNGAYSNSCSTFSPRSSVLQTISQYCVCGDSSNPGLFRWEPQKIKFGQMVCDMLPKS